MSKYHSREVTVDGITFDSRKEYLRWCELALLEKAGQITNLQRQVKFELIPAAYEIVETGEKYKRNDIKRGILAGMPKTKKVCIEQAITYVADFVYQKDGQQVVEDVKGMHTKDYIMKRKMMLYFHNIRIAEV